MSMETVYLISEAAVALAGKQCRTALVAAASPENVSTNKYGGSWKQITCSFWQLLERQAIQFVLKGDRRIPKK